MSGAASEAASGRDLVLVDRVTFLRLAGMVRRLCPDRRDPERFHIKKDAIERELRRLAGSEVRSGGSRARPF